MNTKYLIIHFVIILFFSNAYAQEKYTLSGYVKNMESGEVLNGASIQIKESDNGTVSNEYGFYSITLIKGTYVFTISYVGMESVEKTIELNTNRKLDFEIQPKVAELAEVKVAAKKKNDNVKKIEMSSIQLDIKSITKMPALLGEPDVIRSIQTLPGISTVGEGASGYNARGGNVDQNLILLDEAPVYNSSHLFGFFSVFNPDAVKSLKLIRGGINAQYGGRLSSVLDVRMKEGNTNKFSGSGGVGVIFSRLTLEGPMPGTKKRGSFIVAARRSYIDILSRPFLPAYMKGTEFYFYDLTAKANYNINEKNKVFISAYMGKDVFGSNTMGFKWGNSTTTLRWNHLFSNKFFLNTTAYYSKYDYELGAQTANEGDGIRWKSNIVNYAVKPDFTWYPNSKNTVRFGAQSVFYDIKPGALTFSSGGVSTTVSLPNKYALESALYIENEQKIATKVILSYGLRASFYQYLGPGKSYNYQETVVGAEKQLISTNDHGNFDVIKSFWNPEPRISMKYDINEVSSIKASYNRTVQYIHLISNTAASSPLDMWTLSTNNLKPQLADQGALGYFRNFFKNKLETSVEVYYKWMQNQLEYIKNADVFLNETYEAQLLNGVGRAYGAEFFVRKSEGRLNGWMSYTLARTERKASSINMNDWFPSRFDRTHNLNIVLSYNLTKRIEVAANFIYTSGTPSTFPNSKIALQEIKYAYIENDARNNYRIPDYHRLDLSLTLKPKKKENRKWYGEWVFSVYNVYSHSNAFSVYFQTNPNNPSKTQAIQYSMIAKPIPSFSYNFKF